MSRRHAEIRRSGENVDGYKGYVIVDAGSLNGTYVNTHRVAEQTLRGGDEVQIGKFHMVFLSAERAVIETP